MKIAIASGKGGTGKTTIATNLAVLIAETDKVALVDLDVEEPNSGLFLSAKKVHEEVKYKMIPRWEEVNCSLCGLCQDVCNFHAVIRLGSQILVFPELCHSCYACSELCPTSSLPMIEQKMGVLSRYESGNLTFIESRLEIGQEQAVPLIAQTKEYHEEEKGSESLVIFDSPPGTSCPVIEATKDADIVLLVTEPTPFGLHDLSLAVETMKELGKEFVVIINRFGLGDNKVEEYCKEMGINIIAKISNSRQIAEHYSKGELIYDKVAEFKHELIMIKEYIFSEINSYT